MKVLQPYGSDSLGHLGFSFWCPGCRRTHQVNTVPHDGHDIWQFNGNEEKPTFTPSILSRYRHPVGYTNDNPAPMGYDGPYEEDRCHSYVTDGKIQFLDDSTHELAGKTVDIPEWKGWDAEDYE